MIGKRCVQRPVWETQTGLSLVEVMIGMTLMVIVSTLVVPSFYNMVERNRAAKQANDLMASIALARNEAIARGQSVSMCPRPEEVRENFTECTETSTHSNCLCEEQGEWHDGWITFLDRDADGLRDPAKGEVLIAVQEPIEHYSLRKQGEAVGAPPPGGGGSSGGQDINEASLGFRADGTSLDGKVRFGLCLKSGEESQIQKYARQIFVASSGSSRVVHPGEFDSLSYTCSW